MNVRAYYNEIDGYAAQWLRNLIDAGLIAPGDVDTRSIVDVRASDLAGYTQCHFFAGLGGWSGALRLAGIPDSEPLWTGSCPCQPFSLAGKQKGFDDERHLWPVWRELIRERKPANVFGEQVASATNWLGLVRSDMETLGYAVGCMPVQAASAGADHLRDRFWFVADDGAGRRARQDRRQGERVIGPDGVADSDLISESEGRQQRSGQQRGLSSDTQTRDGRDLANSESERLDGIESAARSRGRDGVEDSSFEWVIGADGKARRVKPGIRLLAHGVPARVAKLRALGNAIDLRPAAQFIIASTQAMNEAAE